MNKLFLTIITLATASFAPMQAMMLSTVRQAARPALPQAQRPVLSVPQRPTMAPAVPPRPLLQPRSFQRPQTLQAHAFSSHSDYDTGNNQNSQYFKPEQPAQKSSSWFGYLLGATAAAGISYGLLQEDEIDKFKRLLKEGSVDISFLEKLTKKANNDVSFREKLTEALCEHPQAFVLLTTQNNGDSMDKAFAGFRFLVDLFEYNPDITEKFTTSIIKNSEIIKKLLKNVYGIHILRILVEKNKNAAQKFGEIIITNFTHDELINSIINEIPILYEELIQKNPQFCQDLAIAITQNSERLTEIAISIFGFSILRELVKSNTQIRKQLITIIAQNPDAFTELALFGDGRKFLEKLMTSDPQAEHAFATSIAQNPDALTKLALYQNGRKFLEKFINQNPQFAQQLTNMILQNFDKLLCIAPLLWHNRPELKETLLQRIKEEACKKNESKNSAKMVRFFQLCMETPTQTSQHLQSNFERTLNSETVKQYIEKQHLNFLYHKAIEKEQQLHLEGYFTFVHGQQRAYYLPEMLYTHLWQIFNNRQLSDFMFAHVKEPATDMQREERKLQKLRQNGRNSRNDRQRLLFLNYAFFGNDTNIGSNSAHYLATNSNVSRIAISPKDACAHFNCSEVYEQHKQELDTLDQEYKDLSDEGTLLVFGIPDKKVNDVVYLAESGGSKRKIRIEGMGETDDTQLILQTLREHPEKIQNTDKIEFCLIMTQKGGGLDPETGIKVIPFIPGDEQKLQELEQRRINLFARIKKSIEEKTQQA